jgi:hypothetical protein
MGVYCPQNATTYTTLREFEIAMRSADFGTKAIGEVTGIVSLGAGGTEVVGPYPYGVEVRAAIGEEFTGVEGTGAMLTCPANTNGIENVTGSQVDCSWEMYDLEIKNEGGWTSALVAMSGYYKYNFRMERCGIFNRAGASANTRQAVYIGQNLNPVSPQIATVRDCICVANATALLVSPARAASGAFIVERMTAENASTTHAALWLIAKSNHGVIRDIFAFGTSTNDIENTGTTLVGIDYLASEDTTANMVTNYLTGITSADFEDYASGDYRIKSTSTLVGTGYNGGNIGAFVQEPVGGSVDVAGTLISSSTANAVTTGIKSALGVAVSGNVSAAEVQSLAARFGFLASTASAQTVTAGFAAFLGFFISEALAQTTVFGAKNEFIEKLGSLVSSNHADTAITAFKQAFGNAPVNHALQTLVSGFKSAFAVVNSQTSSLTSVIGAADNLIRRNGFAVSSNVAQSLVDGFKVAFGVLAMSAATGSAASGAKAATGSAGSTTASSALLLAMAHKAGVLVSVSSVTTLVLGQSPATESPVWRASVAGLLPYYSISGVVNRLQIAASI